MKRESMVKRLAQGAFDLLVIGGGITGAGIAREAALRGLSVAVLEANDFAYGTSSRSTKLIHGGLRYLQNLEFRLVRESVRERQRLLQMAPHLVKATEFIFPVYQGDPDALWKLNVGLTLYDWFAGSTNPIPHRMLKPGAVRDLEPVLKGEGLKGGAIYCDSRTDDGRLTLEVLQSAVQYGAVAANYLQVDSLLKDDQGAIFGVEAVDRLTGDRLQVRSRKVLAACGPWADAIRQMDDPGAPPVLRLTKGVHLTFSQQRLPLSHAVVLRGADARVMFAIPSGDHTYVGTTDTDYDGDPHPVAADAADVDYIINAVRRTFPAASITRADVVSTWAGLRPLVRPTGEQDPSATSRDYQIFESASGLITIAGGKLTAFRAMAAHIVDKLFPATEDDRHLAKSGAPLPGAAGSRMDEEAVASLARETGAPPELLSRLAGQYGAAFAKVAAEVPQVSTATDPETLWLCARARHAVKREMAVRLEDVIWRRTDAMLFTPDNGRGALPALAAEMAGLLGWTEAHRQEQVEQAGARIEAMFAWREQAVSALR